MARANATAANVRLTGRLPGVQFDRNGHPLGPEDDPSTFRGYFPHPAASAAGGADADADVDAHAVVAARSGGNSGGGGGNGSGSGGGGGGGGGGGKRRNPQIPANARTPSLSYQQVCHGRQG